ncbi:FG-GAP-like repeat-containing protein, partial [Candidatus Binatia bacterium]|nr:FG-GAP-like repeat-containing protein [Candidatus Binatia bacterium]
MGSHDHTPARAFAPTPATTIGLLRNGATLALVGTILLMSIAVRIAAADTQTSLGFEGGEGSTPFTGLAQSPEANLFTGAMSTSIPIQVTPGRKNMTPKLSLVYSSSGGASPYGYGWDLPLGRIERTTKWGAPYCSSPHFNEFVINLPGVAAELVADPPGGSVYRPKIEEAYLEATLSGNTWTVYDRSGIKYVFGSSTAARFGTTSGCPAGAGFTSIWYLTHIEDPNNNEIDITYVVVDGVPYPDRVAWGGRQNAPTHWLYADFNWEQRPQEGANFIDRPVSYTHGAKMQYTQRLASITESQKVNSNPFRTYTFKYDDPELQDLVGPRSMLNSVSVTGYPEQTFSYAEGTEGFSAAQSYTPPSGISLLRRIDDSLEVFQTLLDMDGDGRVDMVRAEGDGTWSVWLGCSPGVNKPAGCGSRTYGFSDTAVPWAVTVNPPPGLSALSPDRIRDVKTNGCPVTTCAQLDTIDLTGDGIPDLVWSGSPTFPWQVYPGEMNGTTRGFRPTPIAWSAPTLYSQTTAGDYTKQDLRDMNGDGLLDLVIANSTTWSVYMNNGVNGFEASARQFASPFPEIEYTGDHDGAHALLDFNGDGLPDVVKRTELRFGAPMIQIYYNTGTAFETQPKAVLSGGNWWPSGGKKVKVDLLDINGDGLPDFVNTCPASGNQTRVALNTGGDLEQAQPVGGGNYIPPRPWPSLGNCIDLRDVGQTQTFDMVDVNGDGRIDRVETFGSPPWRVFLNANGSQTTPRAKLLTEMDNGLRGITTVRYRPSTDFMNNVNSTGLPDLPFTMWVTTGIRRTDGLCTASGTDPYDRNSNPCINQGHELVTRYTYSEGFYDAPSREFRGFRFVRSFDVDNNETLTEFHQDIVLKGRVSQIDHFGGNNTILARYEQNEWENASFPGTQAGRQQVWLKSSSVQTSDNTAASFLTVMRSNDRPDAYGNITHTVRTGSNVDPLHTYVEYALPYLTHVFDKPKHIRKTATPNGTSLEEQWLSYDTSLGYGIVLRGNVTKIENYLNTQTARPTTTFEYDSLGNVTKVTDDRQGVTTTTYDYAGTAMYPVDITTYSGINSGARTEHREWVEHFGKPLTINGPNGASGGQDDVMTYVYDSAGRPDKTYRPLDALPAQQYTYYFGERALSHPGNLGLVSAVKVARREPNSPTGVIDEFVYFDGLGRRRGGSTQRVIGSSTNPLSTVVLDDVDYDAAGRVVRRYDPYATNAGIRNNGSTSYDYHWNGGPAFDPLGRVYKATQPNGKFTRTLYYAELQEQYDEMGTKTVVKLDADGHVVQRDTYDGATVYASTTYDYDALGRLVQTMQNGNAKTKITNTYDTMGRKIMTQDPDSGTWSYAYDTVGNLIYQNDPKSLQSTRVCYDLLRRVTAKFYLATDSGTVDCSSQASERYFYDDTTNNNRGAGNLTKVVDTTGETSFTYDYRGRTTGTHKTITDGRSPKPADMLFGFDAADHLITTVYPNGSSASTSYNAAGQPIALTGFVTSIQYDLFGRMTRMEHANSTADIYTYYDPQNSGVTQNHRLREVAVVGGSNFSTYYLRNRYDTYNGRGQLTEIDDLLHASGDLSNQSVFTYDFAGRLSSYDRPYEQPHIGPLTYGYDNLGNIRIKEGRSVYYSNPDKPHQPTALQVPDEPAPVSITHDENGNRTRKSRAKYRYNSQNQLKKVVARGHKAFFTYDYTGRRVSKKDVTAGYRTEVTRYFSDYYQTAPSYELRRYFIGGIYVGSQQTNIPTGAAQAEASPFGESLQIAGDVHGANPVLRLTFSGKARVACMVAMSLLMLGFVVRSPRRRRLGLVAVRVGPTVTLILAVSIATVPWTIILAPQEAEAQSTAIATVLHYHHDHLGSTQVVTGSTGAIETQIRYDAFGQVRGRFNSGGTKLTVAAHALSRPEGPFRTGWMMARERDA